MNSTFDEMLCFVSREMFTYRREKLGMWIWTL